MEIVDLQADEFLALLGGVSFVIDSHKRWLYLSPSWQHLTGFSVEGSLGTPAYEVLHAVEQPRSVAVLEALLQGEYDKVTLETRYVTRAGHIRHAELAMQTATRQPHHQVVVGIFRDISERKQAEDIILGSSQRVQRIVDHMDCMVACLSRDLRVTFANSTFAEFHGRHIDDIIGVSLFNLLHPSQHSQARDHLASLSKHNPQYVFEHWVTRFDGERRYQRWTDSVFFDKNGRISEYQTVGIDLTEHKHTQDALRERENQFRSLVETSIDIIFMLDTEGMFTYLSPSWRDVLGFESGDYLGQSFVTLVHPEDIARIMETFQSVVAGNKLTDSVIYRVKHHDGAWHWHAARGAPLVDAAGDVIGAVGIARDITDKQRDEQTLRASLVQLEQALTNNTMLMREIHHRVKNNLQIVASLLNLQSRQLTDEHAKDALAASRNRVMAMAEIHTMMYQHERADAVVFDAYLYALINRIKHAYDVLGITFSIDGDTFALPVNQAVPLGLIVNELLTNAVKYAFSLPRYNPSVAIRLANDANSTTVTVEDNGIGVTPTFDPDNVDSLGMTIVQALTSQLDGTATFVNRVDGSGLQVTIRIPHRNVQPDHPDVLDG